MPTGYTAAIKDGISFEQYVWGCARGMGALIMMRDLPHDAPIPERFEASDYHVKALADATAQFKTLCGLTRKQAETEAAKASREQMLSREAAMAKNDALRNKYQEILAKVVQWVPPTDDHKGFKEFMLEQLNSSIKFDCSNSYYIEHPAEGMTTDGWLAISIAKAERDIAYHTTEQAKEIERTEGRNAWIKALRESLATQQGT